MGNKKIFSFDRSSKSKKATPVEGFITDQGCYIPTSHKWKSHGYPKFRINGKGIRMSRWVFQKHNGELKEDEVVLHQCDNRECICPAHLKKGSHKDNMMDMINKGRQHKGRVPDVPLEVVIDIMSDWRSALQLSKIHNLSHIRTLNIQKRKVKKYQKIYEQHTVEIEEMKQQKLMQKAKDEADKKTPEMGAPLPMAA